MNINFSSNQAFGTNVAHVIKGKYLFQSNVVNKLVSKPIEQVADDYKLSIHLLPLPKEDVLVTTTSSFKYKHPFFSYIANMLG